MTQTSRTSFSLTHASLTLPRQLFIAFVLALSGLATGSASADSHQPTDAKATTQAAAMPPPGMQQPGSQQHGMSPERHGMEGLAGLNLNETQRALYKTAMGQKMQSMQTGMSLHEELRELSQADSYDEKKVREAIAKHQKEAEEKMVSSSKAMNEFYKSLSPEQKTQLKQMHEHRKEQMKAHLKAQQQNSNQAKKPTDDKTKTKPDAK